MSKKILFCADGTWNGPDESDDDEGQPETTNVWKFFLNLASDVPSTSILYAKEQQATLTQNGAMVQTAQYLHGVGDSDNPIVRMLGGAFGGGLIARIVRGYVFISQNFQKSALNGTPSGDEIFLVGFSRGSYTVRALGGLIADQGLLDAGTVNLSDPLVAYRSGIAAWRRYRANRLPVAQSWNPRIRALFDDVDSFLTLCPPIEPACFVPATIQAIGVWDTVGSMGIPLYVDNGDKRVDVFRFADTQLGDKVLNGFHAVSLDEERADFTPTLWSARNGVVQVLFPGAHSDVGGGYPPTGGQNGLSDGSLAWMIERFSGLARAPIFRKPLLPATPDPTAVAHQPWKSGVFATLPSGPRAFDPYLPISAHRSIQTRLQARAVRADPLAAPGPYMPSTLDDYLRGYTNWC